MFVDGEPYFLKGRAEGGMGIVYFLEETEPRHSLVYREQLAAKTFKKSVDAKTIVNELKNWQQLGHQNILPLLAIGNIDDRLAALAPWRTAGTLHDFLAIKPDHVVTLGALLQITEALDYAWNEHSLLHLDLKPENILIKASTGDLEVADWGISTLSSKLKLEHLTDDDEYRVSGTLPFMSPERFMYNIKPRIQADIYSLGIMAMLMTTGMLPFNDLDRIPETIVSGKYFTNAREILASCAPQWSAFVLTLIAHDPQHRPKSYKEVMFHISRLREKL